MRSQSQRDNTTNNETFASRSHDSSRSATYVLGFLVLPWGRAPLIGLFGITWHCAGYCVQPCLVSMPHRILRLRLPSAPSNDNVVLPTCGTTSNIALASPTCQLVLVLHSSEFLLTLHCAPGRFQGG